MGMAWLPLQKVACLTLKSIMERHSSIHGVFLRNRLYLGLTGVTSFRVYFEKIRRGLLREGKRRKGEWAV